VTTTWTPGVALGPDRLQERGEMVTMRLPTSEQLPTTLARLGITPRDARRLLECYPKPGRPRALWPLLEQAHMRMVTSMGQRREVELLPSLPPELASYAGLADVYVLLATLPDVLRWHQEHRIGAEVTWATLADLGLQMDTYFRFHGIVGFDEGEWLSLHFRSLLFRLGRCQFEPITSEGPGREWLRDLIGDRAPVLNIHIPESGPLDPQECEASLRAAPRFFSEHISTAHYTRGICESWLLDPQLAEYLPETSNIIQFQRRFTIAKEGEPKNDSIIRFVFRRVPGNLDELPRRTRLERAVVDHIQAGRDWRVCSGWLSLDHGSA
jgi:hypothetical protein